MNTLNFVTIMMLNEERICYILSSNMHSENLSLVTS